MYSEEQILEFYEKDQEHYDELWAEYVYDKRCNGHRHFTTDDETLFWEWMEDQYHSAMEYVTELNDDILRGK